MVEAAPLAIISGGAGGLGRAIASRLVSDGMRVALLDLAETNVEAAAATISLNTEQVRGFQCDVGDVDGVRRTTDAVVAAMGPPYALVTAAGIGPLGPILDITPETWDRIMAINLSGTFWLAQAVGRRMVATGRGRIVTVSSISGQRAGYGRGAYGASKAAVIHLTRQLAVELGPCGVTVNSIAPGPVETRLARDHHTPEMRANYHETIPLQRYGAPEEMAAAVAFLCSEDAAYVNGQTLFVDGGFTAGGVAVRMAQVQAARLAEGKGAADEP